MFTALAMFIALSFHFAMFIEDRHLALLRAVGFRIEEKRSAAEVQLLDMSVSEMGELTTIVVADERISIYAEDGAELSPVEFVPAVAYAGIGEAAPASGFPMVSPLSQSSALAADSRDCFIPCKYSAQ